MGFTRVEQRKAYRAIVDQIREQINKGVLSAGERLPSEGELCAAFGVSRATLREALSALEALGLIKTTRGSGSSVSDARNGATTERAKALLSAASPGEIWEARLILEPAAASLAALRRHESDLIAIGEALDVSDRKRELGESLTPHAWNFHLLVAKATHNPAIPTMLDSIAGQIGTIWWQAMKDLSPSVSPHRAVYADQHRAILAAIRASDPLAAREAMAHHIRTIIEDLGEAQAPSTKLTLAS